MSAGYSARDLLVRLRAKRANSECVRSPDSVPGIPGALGRRVRQNATECYGEREADEREQRNAGAGRPTSPSEPQATRSSRDKVQQRGASNGTCRDAHTIT